MLTSCLLASMLLQAPEPAPWTVLVYAAVDNDWERPFLRDIRRMREGLDGVEGIEVVLLIDRSDRYSKDERALGEDFADTRLYRLTGGAAERLGGGGAMASIRLSEETELDTGDPRTLRDFVRFGKRNYPAQRTALMLVSHGEGWSFCPDETDDGEMFTAQLTEALTEEDSVDLLGFDACLMAGVENAYEWRPGEGRFGADVLVAAAPVSSSWPYRDLFGRFRPAGDGATPRPSVDPVKTDAAGFAAVLVEELEHQIREGRSGDEGIERDLQSWAAFDLTRVAEAKASLDALASRLAEVTDSRETMLELRGSGLEAETFVYVWPERNADVNMPFVDLAHLCERVAASEAFDEGTRELATKAAKAASAVVLRSVGFDHYEGFEDGRHGLYLVFPEGHRTTRRGRTFWDRTGWYTPLPVGEGGSGFGRYAWCADGSTAGDGKVTTWFELMDAWFDERDGEGGANGYRW